MTIDAGRLQRAIWLDCQPVAPGRYLVRGGKEDHVIEVDGEWLRCDCFYAQRNGDGCKHCLCVRLHPGDSEVVDALRALVPAPTDRSTEHRTSRPHPESPNSGGTGLIPAKRVPTLTQERRNAGPTVGGGCMTRDELVTR